MPGGSAFIVDTNFLSYTATPVGIAAVVRRNPANDNAGFKLVYESPTGCKTAGGWYTVPDNKQWHTVKSRIEDPQFVNSWGFNFNLESDGDKHNKYFLRSVTVTKIAKERRSFGPRRRRTAPSSFQKEFSGGERFDQRG